VDSLITDIKNQLIQSAELKTRTAETQAESIEKAAEIIIRSLENGGKVLLCGNGGSAADAQHIAAEFVGRFLVNRKALPAVALTTDTSILTAVSNDFDFDQVFMRQVEAVGREGDVFWGISTSGKSENVRKAAELAGKMKIKVIILAGKEITQMCRNADVSINVDSNFTPRIQETHIAVSHIICDIVEKHFTE